METLIPDPERGEQSQVTHPHCPFRVPNPLLPPPFPAFTAIQYLKKSHPYRIRNREIVTLNPDPERGEQSQVTHTHCPFRVPNPRLPPPPPYSNQFELQLLHQYFFVRIISNIFNIGNHNQVPGNRVRLNPDPRGSEPASDPRGSGFQFTLFHGY